MANTVLDGATILAAVKEIAASKGLTEEIVREALESAITKAYIKVLGGGDDAIVSCKVDPHTGEISLAQIKKVVEEVQDDYLEIELEEANEGLKKAKYKVGDDYAIPADVSDLSKAAAMGVKNNLRSALAEAERGELYKVYKDHIGEILTGTVESATDRSVILSINRTTVELTKRELIGDEFFKVGDQVKVYIQEVAAPAEVKEGQKKRGPQIMATRASEGFLKRLFEEEIHEIYDGTVVIKGIARAAGVRAKVAVASTNEDVDATGACIGQGGSRIQKVVAQLGNGRIKEKIDIIEYSDYAPKFVMESVRPCVALGAALNEEEKTAIVILSVDGFKNQLGRYRSNVGLASRLTGYKITLMPEDEAKEKGIEYVTADEAEKRSEAIKVQKEQELYRKKSIEEAARRAEEAKRLAEAEEAKRLALETAAKKAEEEAKKADRPASKAEPLPEMPAVAPKASASPESFPSEALNPAAAALAALAAKPAEEEKTEEKPTEVKITTTLAELEAGLQSEAKKPETKTRSSKKPRKITEEEVEQPKPAAPKEEGMAIYTEEELAAIEEEEKNSVYEDEGDDFDEDYSEYDDYGDDDGR